MTTSDTNSMLLAQGAIGTDADDFMKSELGRTLVGLARIEGRLAMDRLKDPALIDLEQIRILRNQIWLGERFEGWLTELIVRGRQALQQYDVRNSDPLDGEDDHGQEESDRPEPIIGDDDGTAG